MAREGPLSALCSGGSRGGAQTEAPQPLPQDLDDHSPAPPYLKVWIRHPPLPRMTYLAG